LAGFRLKLLVSMMLVVSAVAAIGLLFAQRNVAANVKRDFQREFQGELEALHAVQESRHAMLAEICRTLARRPRIHAALEDNALDLLYPSARNELADVMEKSEVPAREPGADALRARFYRILDAKGRVIPPADPSDGGRIDVAEEALVALPEAPATLQIGCLPRETGASGAAIDEVIVLPIVSTESGEVIAAIALGFDPAVRPAEAAGTEIRSGIWLNGQLGLPSLGASARTELAATLASIVSNPKQVRDGFQVQVEGSPYLIFYERLNPGSLYPPAYEVSLFPLAASLARQRQLAWQFAGAGVLLLLGAFFASNFISIHLSLPVERLAEDSEKNRSQKERAEAALESTSRELQRSARFSADASHQLKTPVSVLRAGLEGLIADDALTDETREEVSALVHQTFRLTNIIEDLLLLSRLDAGRLRLDFSPVEVGPLVAAWLDDLGALPDALALEVETELPPRFSVEGEITHTTLILQNLLENARKYNRPGGRIRIAGRAEGLQAIVTIGNTGAGIPPAAQAHVFDRFHRAGAAENVPGHGLGLNLARELARLHGGDLRLVRSAGDWTEFELRLRLSHEGSVADSPTE
jgi:signal transduction histidine kinase